jgi:hypothetical protein
MRVAQLPITTVSAVRYSLVNQNVQSLAGATLS